MRTTSSPAATPAVKICSGYEGQFYVACNSTDIAVGGNQLPRLQAFGFNAFRQTMQRDNFPLGTLDANSEAQIILFRQNGFKFIWGMADITGLGDNVLWTADPSGWTTYVNAMLAYMKGTLGFSTSDLIFFEWRNEPSGAYNASVLAYEMTQVLPLIQAAGFTNFSFGGPVVINAGQTADRTAAGTYGLDTFLDNRGMASPLNAMHYHNYGGATADIPERVFVQQDLWAYNHTALKLGRSDFNYGISEWGYQNFGGTNSFLADPTRGKYGARKIFMHRALTNCRFTNIYQLKTGYAGTSITSFGLLDGAASPVASFYYPCSYASARVQSWMKCAMYTRGAYATYAAATNSQFYSFLQNKPVFVRGTKSNGDEELAVWHCTSTSFKDQVVVYNSTSSNQTLNITTLDSNPSGTTVTQTVAPGYTTVYLTLSDSPQVLSMTGARFPEFEG